MKTGAFTTWLIGTSKMMVITCRRVEGEIRRRQMDENGKADVWGGVFSSSLQGARVNICLTMFYFGGILNEAPGQLKESR